MVDAHDSKSCIARCESSSLSSGTCTLKHRLQCLCFKVHCVYMEVHDLRHVRGDLNRGREIISDEFTRR